MHGRRTHVYHSLGIQTHTHTGCCTARSAHITLECCPLLPLPTCVWGFIANSIPCTKCTHKQHTIYFAEAIHTFAIAVYNFKVIVNMYNNKWQNISNVVYFIYIYILYVRIRTAHVICSSCTYNNIIN